MLLTVSLLMFRNITQTYKHTPPSPHPIPSPPPAEGGRGKPLPLFGRKGGEGVGWGGGGVRLYVCVMFRNINKEVVSNFFSIF